MSRCPLCGSAGTVVSHGSFGMMAHCGDCFDEDPEARDWQHLRGFGDTAEQALACWLDDAREYAANDEIPTLRIRHLPVHLVGELALQVSDEHWRQRGWAFEVCGIRVDTLVDAHAALRRQTFVADIHYGSLEASCN